MTKRNQEAETSSGIAAGKTKPRRPYEKPQLVVYGKLAELTAGVNGSLFDAGQGNYTRRGGR